MNKWYFQSHDLVSTDGKIISLQTVSSTESKAEVFFEQITPNFIGFSINKDEIYFNLKSTLAQLGLEAKLEQISINKEKREAHASITLYAIGKIAHKLLQLMTIGDFIGKLFAILQERKVRDPDYLLRMLGRCDRKGRPLLCFGQTINQQELIIEKKDGRAIAYVPLQKGRVRYEQDIEHFLPTIIKGLKDPFVSLRSLLKLYQQFDSNRTRTVHKNDIALFKTLPLHIRTVFAKVVDEELPKGVNHTSACILQPDTHASGDIYELYGESQEEIEVIPLEFFTLSPYKEHVFFKDRDQLVDSLEKPKCLFDAFDTSPHPIHHKAAVFVVKGEQLLNLTQDDWIISESNKEDFPTEEDADKMALMVDRYIKKQPSYPFLHAIERNDITSQGILLTRYFPSPRMKRLFLSDYVQANLKGIYFQYPSRSFGMFFSHEDRSFLIDLAKLCIPVYWVDPMSKLMLKYVMKPSKDAGMFVPTNQVNNFIGATTIGVYGSNLLEGDFISELKKLLNELLIKKNDFDHPLLNQKTPLALVTGGGPGAMRVGNQVACELGILSCANLVDFSTGNEGVLNEQNQNPYIQAKMTYRLDRLVERQAEFHLELPIFLTGGIGTDFEFTLEEVRRKVGVIDPTPILLFGSIEYWKSKITPRFQCNLQSGTIKGSEWISNCFFVVRNAKEAIAVYQKFFSGQLKIGKDSPIQPLGFITPDKL